MNFAMLKRLLPVWVIELARWHLKTVGISGHIVFCEKQSQWQFNLILLLGEKKAVF